MNHSPRDQKVSGNVFLLTFYWSEGGGKQRLVSRHPETREYVFPHREWENLCGGTVQADTPYHCTLEPAGGGNKCWIAFPCVGMTLSAEAGLLEIKESQLEKVKEELTLKAERLQQWSERLQKRQDALGDLEEAQRTANEIAQKQFKLFQLKEELGLWNKRLEQQQNRLTEKEQKLESLFKIIEPMHEALVEAQDAIGRLNKLVHPDKRISTERFHINPPNPTNIVPFPNPEQKTGTEQY